MSLQQARRDRFATHPVPLTWELPVAVLTVGLLLAAVTPLVVQAAVAWVYTGEQAWPHHLTPALASLAHGDFGTALPPHVADALPSDRLMWVLTAVGEALVLGSAVTAGLWLREVSGGAGRARHGLATPAQAARALGLARLRRTARVIRPDLYPRRTAASEVLPAERIRGRQMPGPQGEQ